MKTKLFTKAISFVIATIMVLSIMPMNAFAIDSDFVSETHTKFSTTKSTIAPGVTQSINYAYSNDGKQMVYYVATADVNRDDVIVQASYFNQFENGAFGMSKLTDQMAYADELYTNKDKGAFISEHYKAVVGTNGDFYNMSTGQPTGAFVINGVQSSTKANNRPWFAVFEDGTALCGYKNTDWDAAVAEHGAVQQAVGGSQVIVYNGADVTANASGSYNTDRHSRTCVGVTADGQVVMMVLDGRQEPFSCGGSMHELAQIMLEAGCVMAINLDGGGSTTYASRPEGKNEVEVVNRPSDGSERAISSALIIASLAAPSDIFDRAVLTAENEYVTPYSTVNVTAAGVSPAGTAAQIPANATWKLADASLGSIENGVFVSNGKVGVAVVQLEVDGVVVGETTINVVIPELTFDSSEMTVPFNKTFKLSVSGTTNNGLNKVVLKDSDLLFELSDSAMGTIDGAYYTTCLENAGIVGGTITVKCAYDTTKSDTASVTFGKASVIAEDFEKGNIDGWSAVSAYARAGKGDLTFGRFESYDLNLVTSDTGKVRNGNYALEIVADFSTTTASGYKAIKYTLPTIDLTGATAFGMWMYLPVGDVHNLEFDIGDYYYMIEEDKNVGDEGWYFISAPVSKIGSSLSTFYIYMTDQDASYFNVFNKYSIYIDDLTIDYSNATDDREIPKFSDVKVVTGLDNETAMNGQVYNDNVITVRAYAAENLIGNYTGLDTTTAKVYVDGVALSSSAYYCDDRGVINVGNLQLADGTHSFRFEIKDKAGNTGFITKTIVVKTAEGDVYLDRRSDTPQPLAGSIDYYDVIANNIEKIDSLTMTIDLDTLNKWELESATVAYGFKMDYSIDSRSNTATIKITKIGDVEQTGRAVLVAIPVRVWSTPSYLMDKYINAGLVSNSTSSNESMVISTPYVMWQTDRTRLVRIEMQVESAIVNYIDGEVSTFASLPMNVITEHNRYRTEGYYTSEGQYVKGDVTFCKQGKDSVHVHAAHAIADKEATCTETGYTNRTFCEGCNSVVEWGTTVESSGHTYEMTDGVLKCECGKLFNGVHTDGYTYVDGLLSAGWNGDSYYVDGVAVKGIQLVDGYYYNFGDDGISKGRYTGLFFDGEVYRYSQLGELSAGWKLIDGDWYYFRESTKAAPQPGYVYWDGTPYKFEETGKLISGVWVTTDAGTRYYYAGSSYYRTVNTATVAFYEIDGNIYGFDRNGYIYKDGVYGLGESNQKDLVYYEFDENGVRTGIIDFYNYSGIIKTISGNMHYYVNGTPKQMGLIKIGDYFYYIRSGGVVATGSYNCTYNMTDEIPVGVYEFDANGRMLNVPEVKPDEPEAPEIKNGIVNENGTLYYYVDGEKQVNLGLIQIVDNGEPCYIYVRTAGQLAIGKYKVWINNDIVPYASEQDFGTDGKMKNAPVPEVKDGIVNENGTLYYYVNGEKQVNLGLIEIEVDGVKRYIYVRTAGQLAVGDYKVWVNNDIVPYASLQKFDENGYMIVTE